MMVRRSSNITGGTQITLTHLRAGGPSHEMKRGPILLTLSRMSSRALRFCRLAVLGPTLPPELLLCPSRLALLAGVLRRFC